MISAESEMPLIPFGKLAGKPIIELMDHPDYSKYMTNAGAFDRHPVIKNFLVNYHAPNKSESSLTPEHNSLQNKFLDKRVQLELIKNNNKDKIEAIKDKITKLKEKDKFKDKFENNYDTSFDSSGEAKFEDNYNWDLVYRGSLEVTNTFERKENILEKQEQEKLIKESLINDYSEKCKEKKKELNILNDKIKIRSKIDEKLQNKYVLDSKEYDKKMENYNNYDFEREVKKFQKELPQNLEDVETSKKIYDKWDTDYETFKKSSELRLCKENGFIETKKDLLNKNTVYVKYNKPNEKIFIDEKLENLQKDYLIQKPKPKRIHKNEFPVKPPIPSIPSIPNIDEEYDASLYSWGKNSLCLEEENEWKKYDNKILNIKNLEFLKNNVLKELEELQKNNILDNFDKNINNYLKSINEEECFEIYLKKKYDEYFKNLCFKMFDFNFKTIFMKEIKFVDNFVNVIYKIDKSIICCEIKPVVGEDYPEVLRKILQQRSFTEKDRENCNKPNSISSKAFGDNNTKIYYNLIIENYTSTKTSKETLTEIYNNQHKINVIVTEDIFEKRNIQKYKEPLNIKNDIQCDKEINETLRLEMQLLKEENKILKAENKKIQSLEAEIEILKAENKKIQSLEAEIEILKTPKQKNIKDYFKK